MRRNAGIAVIVMVAVVVAILVLRRGPESTVPVQDDPTIASGSFSDDSLGVLLVQMPPGRGWTLRRDPVVPGGPLLSAEARGGIASWKLFVTPSDAVSGLDDVVRRRRDYLASLFDVKDLEQVVGKVLNEDVKDRDGFPAIQWQAVTKPVDVAGDDPIHVVFMWIATLRQRYAYEGIGLLRVPVDPTQRTAMTDSLMQDVVFILESMRFE